MRNSPSGPAFPEDPSGFDSRDCEIIIIDGPGDTTVRPPPPHLLPILLAERERLRRWQKLRDQSPPSDRPRDESGHENPDQGERL
jgi:hypothetical protein